MSSLSQGNPLKKHVRLLPSSSISLIKKAHFYPFCPWGLHRGLENQQTELLSFSPTIYSLSFHLLFYPICLSSLHILSHAPSLISHLFSPPSITCLHTLLFYFFLLFSRCYLFLIFSRLFLSHTCNLLRCLSSPWLSQLKSLSPVHFVKSLVPDGLLCFFSPQCPENTDITQEKCVESEMLLYEFQHLFVC